MNVTLKNKIMKLLQDKPFLRDDWQYVLSMIWKDQIGEHNHSASAYAFLGLLAHKQISSPESVRRSWQLILEENPMLRGPEYGKRHKVIEPEFRASIKKLREEVKPQQTLL